MPSLTLMRPNSWLAIVCLSANCAAGAAATHEAPRLPATPDTSAARPFLRPSPAETSSPAVLRAYVLTKDEVRQSHYAHQSNRFCFVKQAARPGVEGDTATVWMIWHEGGEILGSSGRNASGEEAASLGRSEALAKSVKLATDVVEHEHQIAGSTFLVHRAWVDRILDACRKHGRNVVLKPLRKSRP